MALLERVTTLLRANVNDLIDKAENPEKMLRQLVLDMENQLLQVKTQVAITIADLHLLEKKKKEHDIAADGWNRKAELAVNKDQDDLARAALDRELSHRQMADGFAQQIEDQRIEAETMRSNYGKLQQKLQETESRCELLIAQGRRARAVSKSNRASSAPTSETVTRSLHKMRMKILGEEASNSANQSILSGSSAESLDHRFRRLERDDRIELLLNELKTRQKSLP